MHRAQIIVGDNDGWRNVHLGDDKLRHFLRSMQRPVQVANLPIFFREAKEALAAVGAHWIMALRWDDEFLGSVFLGTEERQADEEAADLLDEVFAETARLLHRFENNNDSADVNLELMRVVITQRERRCFGEDSPTDAVVAHLKRLAGVRTLTKHHNITVLLQT